MVAVVGLQHQHTRSTPQGRRPAADHIGIDLHKRESQICIETEQGEVIEKRIRTERERFEAVFAGRPRAKFLLESMARELAGILYAMWRDGSTYEKRESRTAREAAAT